MICLLRPRVSTSTCGGVMSVRMISKSCMTCAGEKKCAPTMRSGFFIFCATFVMSIVEVFVERMASGRQLDSRSEKIFCLRPRFSITASIAMSTLENAPYDNVGWQFAYIASAFCCVSRPFFTADARLAFTRLIPASKNFWLISFNTTDTPFMTHAVAIPLPMSPPPTTPTHFMTRGARPTSVTPGTAAVPRDAKKKCTSPLHAADDTAFANASCSTIRPSEAPLLIPASIASMHSIGCGMSFWTRFAPRRATAKIFFASASFGSFSDAKDAMARGTRFSAMSSASLDAVCVSASLGAIASTRPSFSASSALIGFDFSIISSAF